MGRFICLVIFLAFTVRPGLALGGEISLHLPLYYWSMASCSSPGKDTNAQCRWQVDGRGGVGINCMVRAKEKTQLREINLDLEISISGSRPPNIQGPGLRKFSYDYAGIGCWAYVPSGMDRLTCKKRQNGFDCNWCAGYYCYRGNATLSQRVVEQRHSSDGLALATPVRGPKIGRE